jgi:hypothetical protein
MSAKSTDKQRQQWVQWVQQAVAVLLLVVVVVVVVVVLVLQATPRVLGDSEVALRVLSSQPVNNAPHLPVKSEECRMQALWGRKDHGQHRLL